jgi:hypothetical protein
VRRACALRGDTKRGTSSCGGSLDKFAARARAPVSIVEDPFPVKLKPWVGLEVEVSKRLLTQQMRTQIPTVSSFQLETTLYR